ncbi:hypothetical protein G6M50_09665 [Agrobacterium rhizogenes]|jgi:hypothetical protein|uniref:hypothetical protein n=1 Tax=Rhizobium sp. WW_1 TaxID=1907375 RepID=UPI000A90BA2B|nr:hypothetical protein [Rhizobium sp. WW_1]MBN9397509.1 hypothetical protein [Candidatus Melainabacteria bacterium]NTJ66291.1 hypothetical protein [Rhizobium rhizogenes]NTJ78060.1 hypothetical protein [Rhizobium rhizogenes]
MATVIAGSGLATIMKDAGLTNGAFYPHFPSKPAFGGAAYIETGRANGKVVIKVH